MGERNLGDLLLLSSSGKVNSIIEGLDDSTLQDFDRVVHALDEEYKWTAGAEAYWLYRDWIEYKRPSGMVVEGRAATLDMVAATLIPLNLRTQLVPAGK